MAKTAVRIATIQFGFALAVLAAVPAAAALCLKLTNKFVLL